MYRRAFTGLSFLLILPIVLIFMSDQATPTSAHLNAPFSTVQFSDVDRAGVQLAFSLAGNPREYRISSTYRNSGHSRGSTVSTFSAKADFDDADSHKWIGEPWGDNIKVDWTTFQNKKVLRSQVTNTGKNWAVMRTDAFPSENWESKIGLRVDIYQSGGVGGTSVKLEVRGTNYDLLINSIYCSNFQPNVWKTCTWNFTPTPNYGAVAYLSIVFDDLGGASPTFYVDNLRLVSSSGEEQWDNLDDGSRSWFYSGNWYDWNPNRKFGLEAISHNGHNSATSAGSIYLQWNYALKPSAETTAEVGTNRFDDLRDWSGYTRISADVKVSDRDVPISVFLSSPNSTDGFGTPTRQAGVADQWKTLTWDLPWPPGFFRNNIAELKFVVNNIDKYPAGTLYIDNITLISDTFPLPVAGLDYVLEDFDDRNSSFNDFSGNWGVINSSSIVTTFVTSTVVSSGAALKVDYNVPSASFTGIWQSLLGHSSQPAQYLDLTNIYGLLNEPPKGIEQLHFWARGSGTTTGTHTIKVELKDARDQYKYSANRYIRIEDSNTNWREIVLDADVTSSAFWSYNVNPPDPTRMKFLVFTIESYFNNPTGTFYLDNIHFVDADDSPFNLAQHSEDEFLNLVSKKTFLYFLDWYDPVTGLFQDRSTFPDLMSTAATGFGLTALTIGDARGWINHNQASEMVLRTLNTLYSKPQGNAATGTIGYKGFFYHFLDTQGIRKDTSSELSSVDTAILMAGVLTVREHFRDNAVIVDLADQLYRRVDWAWMLHSSSNQFYQAWKPKLSEGFQIAAPGGGYFSSKNDQSPLSWDYYTDEAILINILAMGSPTHPVSKDVFYAWERILDSYGGQTLVRSWNGSLFTYVFAHLWIDFSVLGKDNPPPSIRQVDWQANSIAAAKANRQFVADHHDDLGCDKDQDYKTYSPDSWGLTAAHGPDGNYHAYGALPAAINPEHDGTIAPYGAGSTIIFIPDKAMSALKNFFSQPYQRYLWNYRFGYVDAYNLDPPDCSDVWYNRTGYGIDQGPLLISIENYRSGLIWHAINSNRYIKRAICSIWKCTYLYLPMILRGTP